MGNRPGREIELAVRMITEAIYTAWGHRTTASLLQLDVKAALDTINYIQLVPDVSRPVGTFLTERTLRLRFDGEGAAFRRINTGVP